MLLSFLCFGDSKYEKDIVNIKENRDLTLKFFLQVYFSREEIHLIISKNEDFRHFLYHF